MNITTVQSQYYTRPDDQRFQSVKDLKTAIQWRTDRSFEYEVDLNKTEATYDASRESIILTDETKEHIQPTHWSFGQLARTIEAPADYLRRISPTLAVSCINEGLERYRGERNKTKDESKTKFMAMRTPKDGISLRAMTSTTFGRIWDTDVVTAAENLNDETGGRFQPAPNWEKKPDGLYASDRDMFMFLIDGGSMVDGLGERDAMHRGFFLSNSEVGNASLNMCTFMFRVVCGNLCIWDATEVASLRIVHGSGAPGHFVTKAMPQLRAFMEASTEPIKQTVKRAKNLAVPQDEKLFIEEYRKHDFTRIELLDARALANEEEGDCSNLWNLVQGLTATARLIPFVDARVKLQRRAGKLLADLTA